ncbi:MAG: multidrug efflux RND transporter permease subunit [Isosphaeraceae bacterium]|nr:multidrug efflux RND transporter permease subunit [Isosphaeraceae bacterium]
MISRFFIDRPIFASVLSIVITLAGGVALFNLPLSLYPPVSPPVVQVDCKYPGASAQVVAETVAAPIEQQVNGVEGMLYMSSQCTNDGSYNLSVTFQHGMDLNMAQVLVQNRVALAMPLLPEVIKQAGVTTRKRSPDILMAIAINSPEGLYDQLYLSNYAMMHLKEEIARLPGVSDVSMLGQQDYSMRVWVDPEKLAARNLTAGDVVHALREQNMPVATGQIGQPPVPEGQPLQMTLTTRGRLVEPEEFGEIVVKALPDGRVVRLKDVAHVELGAKNMDISCRVNGRPSVSLAIWQLPDANALETADIVKKKMVELAKDFPPGLRYEIRYDTTPFIRESIDEVFKTLQESVILVAVVVLLFLQSWRSSIIPLVAVPVGIIGTFAVMAALGFSLNNLTLFGLVLAIGIVVDDAIVVVEAVEHHMDHDGLSPREATIVAMEEVSGPVIAIGLVLSSVFIPCAFISGLVGQFFRQFALTIAASTLISTFNSLTLSPALAALLLKPKGHGRGRRADPLPSLGIALIGAWAGYEWLTPYVERALQARGLALAGWAVPAIAAAAGFVAGRLLAWPINRLLAGLFGAFNTGFQWMTGGYVRTVGLLLRGLILVLLAYGGMLYLTYRGFLETPTGFVPSQDMGYLLVNVQLPDSASLERTQEVMDRLEQIAHQVPGVKHSQAMTGQSLLLSAFGSNFGSMFLILDEFSKRRSPDLYGEAIANKLRKLYEAEVPEAMVTVLGPPPVRGVGRAGGFKLMVEDRGDSGLDTLQGQAENLTDLAKGLLDPVTKKPQLVGMTSVFRANVPQLYVDVNRTECMAKQVALRDLFDTLQVYLGSLYVNDFNRFGRTWQVIVQADAKFRNGIEDVKRLKVRNAEGQMVPIGALAEIKDSNGPLVLTRYNMYTAAPINGSAAQGVSSGEAMDLMERLADQNLLSSMAIEWTELAFLEKQAGNTAMIVFGFAVVMVFLVLAAQYESWALPLAVILVVPLCLLCSIAGVRWAAQDINIFTQIGFVVLVGLACKNAILIVEFARGQRQLGLPRRQAALEACRLRLRPIVMTSLAFILGVLPLLFAHGAGAEMRRTLGTTVFSGMLGVTIFGLVLTPVFFVLIDWLADTRLFRSRLVRRIGSMVLGIFALGYVRETARRLAYRARKRRRLEEFEPEYATIAGPDGNGPISETETSIRSEMDRAAGAVRNGAGPTEEPDALVERG